MADGSLARVSTFAQNKRTTTALDRAAGPHPSVGAPAVTSSCAPLELAGPVASSADAILDLSLCTPSGGCQSAVLLPLNCVLGLSHQQVLSKICKHCDLCTAIFPAGYGIRLVS